MMPFWTREISQEKEKSAGNEGGRKMRKETLYVR